MICDYDENKKEFSYLENLSVVLKSLNNSSNPGKAFFKEVIINNRHRTIVKLNRE